MLHFSNLNAQILQRHKFNIFATILIASSNFSFAEVPKQYLSDQQYKELFATVFQSEFMLERQQVESGLTLYSQLAKQYASPVIKQRAFNLSIEHDDYPLALSIAKKWVEEDQVDIPAKFYLTHSALRVGDYRQAAQTLDEILRIDPNADLESILTGVFPESEQGRLELLAAISSINQKKNSSLLVLQAALEAQNGKFSSALAKVETALKKRPETIGFISFKTNLLLNLNRQQEAEQWLAKISHKYKKNKDIRLFEVQYLVRQNQQKVAATKLKQMLNLWPDDTEMLMLSGLVHIDLQDYESAVYYFQPLLIYPDYKDQAYFYLGIAAERESQYAQAIDYFKQVEGQLYTTARQKILNNYIISGKSNEAMAYFTQERVNYPDQANFLYQLQIQMLTQIGQTKNALQLIDEALNQFQDDPDLLYSKVLLLDAINDAAELKAILTRLLAIEPNSPTYLNAYAYSLALQNKDLASAEKYALQALKYAPEQAAILDTLGYIYLLQNHYAKATKIYKQAFTLSPSLSITERYAEALLKSGDLSTYKIIQQHLAESAKSEPEQINH